MWKYDCAYRGVLCDYGDPCERKYDLCPRSTVHTTQSLLVTSILFPYIHNPPHWEFTCFLSSSPLAKIDYSSKVLHCLPTAASYLCTRPNHQSRERAGKHLFFPRGVNWHWASEATQLPLPSPLHGLVGAPHAADLPLHPRDPANSQNLCLKLGWPWIMRDLNMRYRS